MPFFISSFDFIHFSAFTLALAQAGTFKTCCWKIFSSHADGGAADTLSSQLKNYGLIFLRRLSDNVCRHSARLVAGIAGSAAAAAPILTAFRRSSAAQGGGGGGGGNANMKKGPLLCRSDQHRSRSCGGGHSANAYTNTVAGEAASTLSAF